MLPCLGPDGNLEQFVNYASGMTAAEHAKPGFALTVNANGWQTARLTPAIAATGLRPTRKNMSTLQTIQQMLVEQFELKEEDVTPDAQLEALGMDSLSVIEFMFSLEDKFQIKLTDERAEIKTVRDIADVVDRVAAEQKKST